MSKFLKLSSRIINTNYINEIIVTNKKYYINILNFKVNGFFLVGSGGINSDNDEIVVCSEKNPSDFKIVSEWIKNI